MQKNLCLVIKATQEYFRHTEDELKTNATVLNQFFESISNIYIPLLNIVEKVESADFESASSESFNFENYKKSFCFALVLPPVLCNLLSDEKLQDEYVLWLDRKNVLGQKELKRNEGNKKVIDLINAEIERNRKLKQQFVNKYEKKLIPFFKDFMQKGLIEILGTCGTEIFIPHFADMKEILSAEIETGLYSYKKFFGTIPDGFWLPQMGYKPGIEELLKAYGYSYTIVDSRTFLLAEKIPEGGTFEPCRIGNFVLMANDYFVENEFFGEDGIIFNENYRNQNSDIGFELDIKELSPVMKEGTVRIPTGFKYLNRNYVDFDGDIDEKESLKISENENAVYSRENALFQVEEDAKKFVHLHEEKLLKACECLCEKDYVADICTFDAERFSRNWYEFTDFLEKVIFFCRDGEITVSSCSSLCDRPYEFEKISPYFSAQSGTGYGENLLSSKNSWMMRYIHKACERMIDLAERFPNDSGLKNRLLNLGAQEILLALSAGLAEAIEQSDFWEFAERRFRESIAAFTGVFDALGSNTVSTEWLTRVEAKDSVFPWMNYKIFSRKK